MKGAASAMMDQTKSFAEPTSRVETWFSVQAKHWYEWAAFAAHQDLNNVIRVLKSPDQGEELMRELNEFMLLKGGKLPGVVMREGKRMPFILLQGMLARIICNEGFNSPFWIMNAFIEGGGKQSMDCGMMGLYKYSQDSESCSKPLRWDETLLYTSRIGF